MAKSSQFDSPSLFRARVLILLVFSYAMPLYLQAISLLMSDSPGQMSSVEDRCRGLLIASPRPLGFTHLLAHSGAQLMNNISSLVMSKPLTPSTLSQAESWARKSAAVCGQEINKVGLKKSDKDQLDMCETTLAVALFNIASLREVCTAFFWLPFG